MKLTPPPVKIAAQELRLRVYQPEKIREPEAVERIRALTPDLLVVVARLVARIVKAIRAGHRPHIRAVFGQGEKPCVRVAR